MATKNETVTLKMAVNNHEYILQLDQITPRITRKVRQATGISLMRAIEKIESDPDLDLIMTMFYAAALQTDPATDFDKLEDELAITYTSEINIEAADEGEA